MVKILRQKWLLLLIGCLLILVTMMFNFSFTWIQHNQFILQAQKFLEGHIDVDGNDFGWLDVTTTSSGKVYWPLGVFPSLLLTPFVFVSNLVGFSLTQGHFVPALVAAVFYVCYALAKRHNYSRLNSLYLAAAFCFGSVFSLVVFIPNSWYWAHGLTALLILAALLEFEGRRRYFLVGLLIALLVHTRYLTVVVSLYFLWQIYFEHHSHRQKLRHVARFLLPVLISLVLLGVWNYVRFGNVFETGYPKSVPGDGFLINSKKLGYFSPVHILTNFYWYFMAGLQPVFEEVTRHLVYPYITVDPMGYGFFFVSPIFLMVFRRIKLLRDLPYWGTALLMLFLYLNYHATGFVTFGPRYMIDLLPLLYLILLRSFRDRKLEKFHYAVILCSAMFNAYLVLNLFRILGQL